MTRRMHHAIVLTGIVALVGVGAAGCANSASVTAGGVTLSVPTSDASALQACEKLGISTDQCTQALRAVHGAGLP
jgi:hypothetical protein